MSDNDTTEQTPGWMFFAQDGSYGDATGLRFVRSDHPALNDQDELPDDPRDREVVAFGTKHGTNDVWVLVVEDGANDDGPNVQLHTTEKSALDSLRSSYQLDEDVDDGDVLDKVVEQHVVVHLDILPLPHIYPLEF